MPAIWLAMVWALRSATAPACAATGEGLRPPAHRAYIFVWREAGPKGLAWPMRFDGKPAGSLRAGSFLWWETDPGEKNLFCAAAPGGMVVDESEHRFNASAGKSYFFRHGLRDTVISKIELSEETESRGRDALLKSKLAGHLVDPDRADAAPQACRYWLANTGFLDEDAAFLELARNLRSLASKPRAQPLSVVMDGGTAAIAPADMIKVVAAAEALDAGDIRGAAQQYDSSMDAFLPALTRYRAVAQAPKSRVEIEPWARVLTTRSAYAKFTRLLDDAMSAGVENLDPYFPSERLSNAPRVAAYMKAKEDKIFADWVKSPEYTVEFNQSGVWSKIAEESKMVPDDRALFARFLRLAAERKSSWLEGYEPAALKKAASEGRAARRRFVAAACAALSEEKSKS